MNERKQRTVTRKCVTTTIKSARLLIENKENLVDNETKLRGLATLLRNKGAALEELDAAIISSCDDEELDREATETTDYMSEIYTCLAEIESAMSTLRIAPTSPTPSRRSRVSTSIQSPIRSRRSSPTRSQRSSPIRTQVSSPSRSLPRMHGEDLSPERRDVYTLLLLQLKMIFINHEAIYVSLSYR